MTNDTEETGEIPTRVLSDTPLLTRQSVVVEQTPQADRSSQAPQQGHLSRPRKNHDRREKPPLHVEVARLQREVGKLHNEVGQLHNDMGNLQEHMDSLRTTVLNASEASSLAVRDVLTQLRGLHLVEEEEELLPFQSSDALYHHLQKECSMDPTKTDTTDSKTLQPAATAAPGATSESSSLTLQEEASGMGTVTKAILTGVTLAVTFTAGLVFGKRRGYTQAMNQMEDAQD